jgi:hypothetical protein
LATPDDFSLPPHHQLWTEETYAAFAVPEGQKAEEGNQGATSYESPVRDTHGLTFMYS